MDFSFTSDQETLRASVREVLTDKSGPAAYRAAMASTDGCDTALWKIVGELGWTGVGIAEEHGGLGLGMIELCILHEELGRAVAAVPFFSTVGLAAQVVEQAEPSDARSAFLAGVAAGEIRATLAFGGAAFDVRDTTVEAAPAANGSWTLSGRASLVPEAHLADRIVTSARTASGELMLFVVPASALPAAPRPEASLDGGRRLADVDFTGVSVQADAVLGSADEVLARGIERAAVLLGAEAVGVATVALEMSVAYTREREQFGRPIGAYQAISHTLSDVLLWNETARSHVYYAAWAAEEGTPDARIAAATAKAAAADAARIATADGIQVHGGIGFTWEHDLHLYYRRAKFDELYLGDAGVWRERIASVLAAS
ncbi:MAG: acyl-CoA dehydrogenase family protein [Actinomycetota bacterium]